MCLADAAANQVVIANDIAYLVGSGTTGCWQSFAGLSGVYTVAMIGGALMQKTPPVNYTPAGFVPSDDDSGWAVKQESIMHTPQLYLVWFGTFGYSLAGVSILSCAKTMITDVSVVA